MNHWDYLKRPIGICFMSATVLPIFTSCKSEDAEKKPNIILFLVDDMGWQDTSVPFWTQKTPLNEKYNTPGMERLVKDGMMFTQAYACSKQESLLAFSK